VIKKSFVLAIAASAVAVQAQGNDYTYIGEMESGKRLLVVNGSGDLFVESKVLFARAEFVWAEDLARKTTAMIAPADCVGGQGRISWAVNGSDKLERGWWTTDGGRMYDVMARALCAMARQVAKDAAASTGPSNTSRKSAPSTSQPPL
jgi:hypothetical protein